MTINSYTPGQTAIIFARFTDPICRVGLAPTTLHLRILDPTGNETIVTSGFDNPEPGVYTWPLLVKIGGTWPYRWEATGLAFDGACEGSLIVKPSPFTIV